jgi:hypothetical protein
LNVFALAVADPITGVLWGKPCRMVLAVPEQAWRSFGTIVAPLGDHGVEDDSPDRR